MAINIKNVLGFGGTKKKIQKVGTTAFVSSYMKTLYARECVKNDVDFLFALGDEPVEASDLASPDCLLPVVAWHANNLYKSAFNHPMGILLNDSADSFLGKMVDMDGIGVNTSTLLLFLNEAYFDIRDNLEFSNKHMNVVNIDRLASRFISDMKKRKEAALVAGGSNARG